MLIPFPRAAISSLERIVTLFVKSPSLLSISLIISVISFFVLESGRITLYNTLNNANAIAAALKPIVTALINNAFA